MLMKFTLVCALIADAACLFVAVQAAIPLVIWAFGINIVALLFALIELSKRPRYIEAPAPQTVVPMQPHPTIKVGDPVFIGGQHIGKVAPDGTVTLG